MSAVRRPRRAGGGADADAHAGRRAPAFPCAICGTALERTHRGGGRGPRALQILCPRCRYRIYDYPRVCVGMLVVRRGALLVLTRGEEPRRGCIDLPGGFLEAGEDLEVAARRELREETGLRVGRASTLGIYWDVYDLPGFGEFPTLNGYYLATWRSGAPRAGDDAAAAHWVPLAELTRPAFQRRFAWRHMRQVVRDLRRAVGAE
jgi:ADP-ribose pyrophosphatase YjhB (NUDIX family)